MIKDAAKGIGRDMYDFLSKNHVFKYQGNVDPRLVSPPSYPTDFDVIREVIESNFVSLNKLAPYSWFKMAQMPTELLNQLIDYIQCRDNGINLKDFFMQIIGTMDGPQRLIDACKNSSEDMQIYYYFPQTSKNEEIHLTDNAMSIFGMDCDFVSEGKNNQSSTNGDIYEFTATF